MARRTNHPRGIKGWSKMRTPCSELKRKKLHNDKGGVGRFAELSHKELVSHCDEVLVKEFTLVGVDSELLEHVHNRLINYRELSQEEIDYRFEFLRGGVRRA